MEKLKQRVEKLELQKENKIKRRDKLNEEIENIEMDIAKLELSTIQNILKSKKISIFDLEKQLSQSMGFDNEPQNELAHDQNHKED